MINACYIQNTDIAKLLVDNFKDQININLQDMGLLSAKC